MLLHVPSRLRRAATTAALLGVIVTVGFAGASTASAATDSLAAPTVAPTDPTTADSITISGTGCTPAPGVDQPTSVSLVVTPSDSTDPIVVEPAADGSWSTVGTVSGAGIYTITASCDDYINVYDYPAVTFVATNAEPAAVTSSLGANPSVLAGATIPVAGVNYRPGEEITATVIPPGATLAGAIIADENGSFVGVVILPTDAAPGPYQIVFAGTTSGRSAALPIVVIAPVLIDSGGLANTGTPAQSLTILGLGFVVTGAGVLALSRERHTARHAAA